MLRRLSRDRRGSAALEFALVAPILLLLYYGMAEITQGLLLNRRAGHVSTTVGDLIAQSSTVTSAQVEDVFNISSALIAPASTAPLSIRVTSISIDSTGKATVNWCKIRGTALTQLGVGTRVTDIPTALMVNGQSLIQADTSYTFTSPIQQTVPTPIIFKKTTYLKPRSDTAITLK